MKKSQNLKNRGQCIHGHFSLISNSAWTDLNTECTVLRLHEVYDEKRCKCQKQLTLKRFSWVNLRPMFLRE